jgi:transposase-like protein
MLRELNVVEQRYRAVQEVMSGIPVVEGAERYGVARQTMHRWMARYRAGGIDGLADRSHAPNAPRRLVFELDRRGYPAVSRSTVYRVLVRYQLIERSRAVAVVISTSGGNARPRWSCGSWMSPRACSSLTAASARSSPGSMTIPGSASSPQWCCGPPAGQHGARRPARHPATGRPVVHILAGGILTRTMACPVPEHTRPHLRGARAGTAGPPELPRSQTARRRVSSRGAIMIGGQRIQVGLLHAGKTAEVTIETDTYRVAIDDSANISAPSKSSRDIKRHKASRYQPAATGY